jgi:hypothetical protein
MMINGTWAATTLINSYNDCKWTMALLPELRPGVGQVFPLATGGVFAVNAKCTDKDFAAEIINNLFTNVENHKAAVTKANFQPYPIHAVTGEFFKGMDSRMVAMYDILMPAQADGDTGYCSWTFFPSDVRVYMNENTDALFLNRLSIQDYLARVQSLMEADIKNGSVPPIP